RQRRLDVVSLIHYDARYASADEGAAEATWPRIPLGEPGLFSWSNAGGRGMSELEAKHYLSNGTAVAVDPREALEWAGDAQVKMVDLKFCDLLGTWQHVTLPL